MKNSSVNTLRNSGRLPNCLLTPLIRSVVVATVFCMLFPAGSFAATLKIGGTGAALGTMRILADELVRLRPDISVEIPNNLGSVGGIKAVLAGALDIALSSRQLKPKERDKGARATHYATTPFVLVTHWHAEHVEGFGDTAGP